VLKSKPRRQREAFASHVVKMRRKNVAHIFDLIRRAPGKWDRRRKSERRKEITFVTLANINTTESVEIGSRRD